MTFTQAIQSCLSKYATFSGRASRPEYWLFFLFVILVGIIASLIDWSLFGSSIHDETGGASVYRLDRQPVSTISGLALFLPHFAAAWRRMHDTGRSGLFVLLPSLVSIAAILVATFGLGLADMASGRLDSLLTGATLLILIPLLILGLFSPLIVFFWLIRRGQPGPNPYGPNPQEVSK